MKDLKSTAMPWLLFEQNPCAMWVSEPDSGRVLYANQAAEEIFGYKTVELVGLKVTDLRVDEDFSKFLGGAGQVRAGKTLTGAARLRRKDGSTLSAIVHTRPLNVEKERLLLSVVVPAGEDHAIEGALREKEDLYKILTDHATDMVSLINEEGIFLYVSPSYKRVLGYETDELVGTSAFRDLHPDDLEWARNEWLELLSRGVATARVRIRHKDGSYRVIEAIASIVPYLGGRCILANSRDATTQLQAIDAVRISEERLRTVLDTTLDAVISVDGSGCVLDWNPQAAAMFGWSTSEAMGRKLSELIVPADLRGAHESGLNAFVENEAGSIIGKRVEMRAVNRQGTEFPVELTLAAAKQNGGWVFHGFVRDLSEQRRLEQQLLEARKLESIGRLAGGIAHDFNNVLTAILGYAEVAGDYLGNPERMARYLKEITKAGERAADLTKQLLAFARRQLIEPRLVDLNELALGLDGMLRRLLGEQVDLATLASAGPLIVRADPGQLEQVLVNLATNARDAMPQGGKLTIETHTATVGTEVAERHPEMPPGEYAMLAVSDTGLGMDEQIRGRIFDPFFTTKDVGKGTGLGLATVYGVVKQSGGHIWVYSEPGHGTTFRVYLPLMEGTVSKADDAAEIDLLPAGRETILLAEDEDAVRQLATVALQDRGYVVLAASGAQGALALAGGHTGDIHLLITDMVMPEMKGDRLAAELLSSRPETRVLYISGYTDAAILQQAGLHGNPEYLQKPFSPSALVRKVREMLA